MLKIKIKDWRWIDGSGRLQTKVEQQIYNDP